jgi:hypothetical protein
MLGAVGLFCYLSARLLLAALSVLILIMFAPVMFLVAALGESGRASVVAWLMRLAAAVLTKVIYAFFLAVIVAASVLIAHLKLSFLPTWIVFATFWWGVLLKRNDLLALLSLDPKTATPSGLDFNGAGGGNALSEIFYAKQLVGDGRRLAGRVTRGATAAPRAALRASRNSWSREKEADRAGESDTARQFAREELENDARFTLERRNGEEHQAEVERGAPILAREQRLSRRLADIDSRVARERSSSSGNGSRGGQSGGPLTTGRRSANRSWSQGGQGEGAPIAGLLRDRGQVEQDLIGLRADPEYARARSAGGSRPREVTHADVQAWISDRRSELARDPGAAENLQAAGISPEQHWAADRATQDAERLQARATMERHRELLDRAGVGPGGDDREPMSKRELVQARREAQSAHRTTEWRDTSQGRAFRHAQRMRNDNRRRRRNVR